VKPGERIQDYERITVRLPGGVKARLLALVTVTGRPAWRLLVQGVDLVRGALPPADRKLVDQLAGRIAQQGTAGAQSDDD
jgi:hypothetical protein